MRLFLGTITGKFLPALLLLTASMLRSDLKRKERDAITAIGVILYITVGILLLRLTPERTLDSAFFAADRALGLNPLAFASFVMRHKALIWILMIAYQFLPFAVMLAWVIEQDRQLRRAVLMGGCLCFVFYFALPAVGPFHFDWLKGSPLPNSPGNCMPSMHFTWALLIALNARGKLQRAILSCYAGLIALATVGLGEHYVIDLIAAVPFTFGVQAMAAKIAVPLWRTHESESLSLEPADHQLRNSVSLDCTLPPVFRESGRSVSPPRTGRTGSLENLALVTENSACDDSAGARS